MTYREVVVFMVLGAFYVAHSGAVNVSDTNLLTCSPIMTVLLV